LLETLQRRPNNWSPFVGGKEGASAFEVIVPFEGFKQLLRTFYI